MRNGHTGENISLFWPRMRPGRRPIGIKFMNSKGTKRLRGLVMRVWANKAQREKAAQTWAQDSKIPSSLADSRTVTKSWGHFEYREPDDNAVGTYVYPNTQHWEILLHNKESHKSPSCKSQTHAMSETSNHSPVMQCNAKRILKMNTYGTRGI